MAQIGAMLVAWLERDQNVLLLIVVGAALGAFASTLDWKGLRDGLVARVAEAARSAEARRARVRVRGLVARAAERRAEDERFRRRVMAVAGEQAAERSEAPTQRVDPLDWDW
jgi:hypothetical protein